MFPEIHLLILTFFYIYSIESFEHEAQAALLWSNAKSLPLFLINKGGLFQYRKVSSHNKGGLFQYRKVAVTALVCTSAVNKCVPYFCVSFLILPVYISGNAACNRCNNAEQLNDKMDFERTSLLKQHSSRWRRPFFPLVLGFITAREEKERNQNICRCFFSKIKNHAENRYVD